ncbi:MAG TPA: GyrI-like domain-containing protein [Gemmatimonadaceae bacterium]|nr:GyrI-like domain-containing protein [Gemmatimonadaceae bacterium]
MSKQQGGRTSPTAPRRAAGVRQSAKVDVYDVFRHEYVAPKAPALVDVSRGTYLAIAGRGEPGATAFTSAVSALYSVAFTVKMARKCAGRDFTVSKLESLWWSTRGRGHFLNQPRSSWEWRLLIRVPDYITPAEGDAAIERLIAKGKPKEVRNVALEHLHEGRCVQVLHVGPYATEGETIDRMREFAAAQKLRFNGAHHEIYLSDPRRVVATRLRTILRVPVVRSAE